MVDVILNLNPTAFLDAIQHLPLPAFVLGFEGMAVIARTLRSSMVEELDEDYVVVVREGLPVLMVVRRHALRNALVPTVTVIGLSWGSCCKERWRWNWSSAWPGLGRWATDATQIQGRPRDDSWRFVSVISIGFSHGQPVRRRDLMPI